MTEQDEFEKYLDSQNKPNGSLNKEKLLHYHNLAMEKLKAQILKEEMNNFPKSNLVALMIEEAYTEYPLAGLSDIRLEIIINLRKKRTQEQNTIQEYYFAEQAKDEQKRRKQLSNREKGAYIEKALPLTKENLIRIASCKHESSYDKNCQTCKKLGEKGLKPSNREDEKNAYY